MKRLLVVAGVTWMGALLLLPVQLLLVAISPSPVPLSWKIAIVTLGSIALVMLLVHTTISWAVSSIVRGLGWTSAEVAGRFGRTRQYQRDGRLFMARGDWEALEHILDAKI